MNDQTIDKIFGVIERPNFLPSGEPQDVLIKILNIGLNGTIIIAGLFTLVNFLLAGYDYIQSEGDPKKIEHAHSRIKVSLAGLLIVVAAPLAAAIVGVIVFKNPTAILRPEITTFQK